MSTRTAQVEAAISRFLSEAIRDLRDPRVPLVVTIERVQVSADLQHARVFVSTLGDLGAGDSGDTGALIAALEHARGFLQKQLSSELNLRRTPTLSFLPAPPSPFEGPPDSPAGPP